MKNSTDEHWEHAPFAGKFGWIGVDLDGTLAEVFPARGIGWIGDPVPSMVQRVKDWVAAGRDVRIVTARVSGTAMREMSSFIDTGRQVEFQRGMIDMWMDKHLGMRLPVTCDIQFGLLEYWDDRSIPVIRNKGIRLDVAYKSSLALANVDLEWLSRSTTPEAFDVLAGLVMDARMALGDVYAPPSGDIASASSSNLSE